MKKSIVGMGIILCMSLIACTNPKERVFQIQKSDSTSNQIQSVMNNLIAIVEIPTHDFQRAIGFYKATLGISIEEIDIDGVRMGLFNGVGEGVAVQLIEGANYKPSADGVIVYLNGGNDLQDLVDKIKTHGGNIVVPKTSIGPELGFFALFTDTEGNRLGLYSKN